MSIICLSVYLTSLNGGWKLLPPANEVLGKIIFSQVSVRRQVGLCLMSHPVWLPGPLFILGISVPGSMFLSGGLCWGKGLCSWGPCPGRFFVWRPPESEKRAVHIRLECFLLFKIKQHVYSISIFMTRLQLPKTCVWVSFLLSRPFQYFPFDSWMSGPLWDSCISHLRGGSRVSWIVSVSRTVQ